MYPGYSRCLTLPLSGEAAVASAKPVGGLIGELHGEPESGFVRFNGGLGRHGLAEEPGAKLQAGNAITAVLWEPGESAIEDLTRKTQDAARCRRREEADCVPTSLCGDSL